GLIGKLKLVPSSALASSRVYVPVGALIEGDGDRASVFVLESGRAKRRDVQVAFIEGETVALTQGINVGEQIITDGALYLEDGEAVSVLGNEDLTHRSQTGRPPVSQDAELNAAE